VPVFFDTLAGALGRYQKGEPTSRKRVAVGILVDVEPGAFALQQTRYVSV
jgi:hypothetical protein